MTDETIPKTAEQILLSGITFLHKEDEFAIISKMMEYARYVAHQSVLAQREHDKKNIYSYYDGTLDWPDDFADIEQFIK